MQELRAERVLAIKSRQGTRTSAAGDQRYDFEAAFEAVLNLYKMAAIAHLQI